MGALRRSPVRRAGQVLTGLGALVVLVGVLAGGPIALLAFAGNPLPDHLPTLTEIGTALTSRDDGQLFLRALAVVGWFGWATFAFSVLVELCAAVVHRPAPKLPGMGRQQKAAAALVGSVALILAASPAAASAAALTAPAVVAPAVAASAVTSPAVAAPGAAGPAPAASKAGDPAVYRVAKGDYLGEVADRYLDDFDRYRELARLNRLTDPDRIRPGQLITLPEDATDSGARRHAAGRIVVTKPAETAPAKPGGGGASSTTPKAKPKPTPRDATPTVEAPVGQPPAMSAGASRATAEEGINRPLAISAVLAVASIVGAQIGALLGLRKRPAPARALSSGRHRRG